jgi:hypothetical protein
MHHHNTPVSVWHGQPFEVPVLDAGMRWALVRYRNPREQPRKFSFLKNLFVVRKGQSFGAVGNESCTSIRVWQFRWWVSWPKSKRLQLAVRKLSERRMAEVNASTQIPAIHAQVALELERATLQKHNTPRIAIHMQSKATLNLVSYNLQLNTINDEPNLKTFRDTL